MNSILKSSAVQSVMNDVDLVVVGADVIALDGSVINKIGICRPRCAIWH